jgi:hypothetical protein
MSLNGRLTPDISVMDLSVRVRTCQPRFVGGRHIRRFVPLVISEKRKGFVWVLIGQNVIRWPPLRTRTTTRMNVDDGMRGRMAGALAVFTKRHFATPAQSYTQL